MAQMYLYNGVELPALPEPDVSLVSPNYDGEPFSYCVIIDQSAHKPNYPYAAYWETAPWWYNIGDENGVFDSNFIIICSAYDGNTWGEQKAMNLFDSYINGKPVWANHEIRYSYDETKNGDLVNTVYLAASEPTKFVEFNVTNDLGTGGRIIACYEDVYDANANSSTLTITAIKAQVTNSSSTHLYYPDGELWLTDQNGNAIPLTNISGNEKDVLTFRSSSNTAYVNIDTVNTWYDLIIDSSDTVFTTTTYTPIVHDHEGSEIVNISLGKRSDSSNPRFAFYTLNGSDPGYSWGTIDSQTITLTVGEPEPEEPEEPLIIPDHAYGKQQYLFNGVKLPKLPRWDKTAYPHFFIRYHETDGNGFFSLVATNTAGVVEDKTLTFKTLVAYIYNDVQLPALPEWDKETYPYAYIVQNTDDSDYYLVLYTAEHKVSASGLAGALSNRKYRVTDGEWKLIDGGSLVTGTVIWANNTVYYTESIEGIGGTVYLQATDPIPVYE